MSGENPKNIRAALIGAGATIIAALIAVFPQFSDLRNELKSAKEHADSLEEECRRLEQQLAQAGKEKESLTEEADFQDGAEQVDEQIMVENTSLEADINELKNKLLIEESKRAESDLNYQNIQASYNELNSKYENLLSENASLKEEGAAGNVTESSDSADISYESIGSKISVFTMDVFQNKSFWFTAGGSTSEIAKITDTYGNEYPKAHFAIHGTKEKGEATNPIYLLDCKYARCEGQIAWSKWSMNEKGSAWIDFYSGDELIFSTDAITAVDEAISFEFDVSDVKTLEIVCNGSTNRGKYIVYPYLNLVK